MHAIVHNHEPPRRGRVLSERVPGIKQHGDVVVPMQEDEGLLAQNYEHCVAQLRQFGENEHPRPEAGHFVLFDEAGRRKDVVSVSLILLNYSSYRSIVVK